MTGPGDATRPMPGNVLAGARDLAIWAKLSKGREPSWTYHPLLCHMLDVAAVASVLWQLTLRTATRQRIAKALGLDDGSAGRWLPFLAGLHDLGKASPSFQLQPAGVERGFRGRLRDAGLTVPQCPPSVPHGAVTASRLGEILVTDFAMSYRVAQALATVVGGHHGTFPTTQAILDADGRAVGDRTWAATRCTLARQLARALAVEVPAPQGLDAPTAIFLAGFVSIADWIGSAEAYFPHLVRDPSISVTLDPAVYRAEAESRARHALERLGFSPWPVAAGMRTFAELFPSIAAPNGLQQAVMGISDAIDGPALILIEAPMGEGKTEAAMYAADRWMVAAGRRGMYFALPTQATSNQMFGRVRAFLASRGLGETVDLQLLHGHAALSSEFAALRRRAELLLEPNGICEEHGKDKNTAHVVAAEWFTHRKRGLLGPFGVGTVDQMLLAALQSRHVFVRLFGLTDKTVIIDEVHAYDMYMTTLLERLLNWLASLGCSVVLMSATLPKGRRAALVDAYARGLGQTHLQQGSASYPRVAWVAASGVGDRSVGTSERASRSVSVEWVHGSLPPSGSGAFELGGRLEAALAHGGSAAVVCNTVARAQEVYRALKTHFPLTAEDGAPELDLLHARFPFEEREQRELRTLVRFGKPDSMVAGPWGEPRPVRRPRRAVLVATQIIEQSLDLDFDLLVTDLAPADLVLQRVGRLQRHSPSRPAGLTRPVVWLVGPDEGAGGLPDFGRGTEAVYDGHVLLRSWLALRHQERIRIPEDIEALIEAVYDERACPDDLPESVRARWEETLRTSRDGAEAAAAEAHARGLKPPWYTGPISTLTVDPREEDAPEFHQAHQALTRLSEPTVPVVCLYQGPHRASLDRQGVSVVDVDAVPNADTALRLLRRSVSISDHRVIGSLLAAGVPPGWRRSPLLRHHRPVLFDTAGGSQVLGRHRLRLDPEIGLTIVPAEEGGRRE